MPSPFPGMNPYLEREEAWHDFHERFVPHLADVLGSQLQPRYFVKIDQHICVHEMDAEPRRYVGRSDLSVTPTPRQAAGQAAAQLVEAPALVQQPMVDVESISCLEIRDRYNRQLITAIELLGPSNKRSGDHRNQYLWKRSQKLTSGAHFVEIDLLRGGPRLPWEKLPACDYYVVVSRVERRPDAGIWPIRLREPLPVIPIPLKEGEADARRDLQQALHRVYDAARYGLYIYAGAPEPPLSPADAAWALALIAPPQSSDT